MRTLMCAFLALAFLATGYGIVNARFVRVTRVTVAIRDLPPAWEGRTAVQLSDVHLGAVNNTGYAEQLHALADREQPDLIFFTGDYFDGSWPTLDDLGAKLRIFRAPLGTYFINGNHEIYDGREAVIKAVEPAGVTFLRDRFVEVDGVQILGIDWGDREFGRRDIAPVLASLDPTMPAIALCHEPRYGAELAAAGVDLRLSGHTHRGQMFPASLVTRMIYGPEHTGQNVSGDFTSYTSTGAGTWGPPLRIGTNPEIVVITFVKK
jgi:predicted MPP superfamily phosphohydrolase